jgi:DNA-binding transcriptional regulator YdaS (Cro superfamily)
MKKKQLLLKAKIIERFGSQADFAEVVGLDESLVSRIVCGRRLLRREQWRTWAKALKVSVRDLKGLLEG